MSSTTADHVFRGGRIWSAGTSSQAAESVAVAGGRIVFVGDKPGCRILHR